MLLKKVICVVATFSILINSKASACTSFSLKKGNNLYFAHSLNQGDWDNVPGLIFINQRDVWKKGFSWDALLKVNSDPAPSLVWKSKFGSVTFNPLGKEFPDGGMNEKGLYVWEMSLGVTTFPEDKNKPKLFMMQWIQYLLDNFTTIEEVIENAGQVSLDGWEWHFFIADKSGKSAIIDFIDGKPVVYSGDNMPVSLCCNSVYSDAIRWLKLHKDFGGDLEVLQDFAEIPRFIYGAKLLQDYSSQDPIEYSFSVLDNMSNNVRWAVVFDINSSKVYFKTNLNQEIRHFTFSQADFCLEEGTNILDIECSGSGNIRKQFIPYDEDVDRELIKSVLEFFCKDLDVRKNILDDQNVNIDGLARNLMAKIQHSGIGYPIMQSSWAGNAKYPSSDGYMEVPMTLEFYEENNRLSGKVNDNIIIKNLPISNADFKGGILTFTVRVPESKDILYYQLFASMEKLDGNIEILGKSRKAILTLERK